MKRVILTSLLIIILSSSYGCGSGGEVVNRGSDRPYQRDESGRPYIIGDSGEKIYLDPDTLQIIK